MRCTIAIDGPSASGKSSAAEIVAKKLKFSRLDSGLLYRAITYIAVRDGADIRLQDRKVMDKIRGLDIELKDGRVIHGNEDITAHLRTSAVDRLVGTVSKELYVREKVHELQHQIISGAGEGLVIDGRDIGTVVVPNAFLKVFITAKDTTRALRRVLQTDACYDEVLRDIQQRDFQDINRVHGPLRVADGAFVIENDDITLEETAARIVQLFERQKDRAAPKMHPRL